MRLPAALAAVCLLTATALAQTPPVSPPASQTAPAPGGRHPEEGRPFVRAYAPLDVNAAGQNWSIVPRPHHT